LWRKNDGIPRQLWLNGDLLRSHLDKRFTNVVLNYFGDRCCVKGVRGRVENRQHIVLKPLVFFKIIDL
jgi:hypothetical protein